MRHTRRPGRRSCRAQHHYPGYVAHTDKLHSRLRTVSIRSSFVCIASERPPASPPSIMYDRSPGRSGITCITHPRCATHNRALIWVPDHQEDVRDTSRIPPPRGKFLASDVFSGIRKRQAGSTGIPVARAHLLNGYKTQLVLSAFYITSHQHFHPPLPLPPPLLL